MANCVDPDEMVHHEPSHQDLLCLQRYLFLSLGMKALTKMSISKVQTYLLLHQSRPLHLPKDVLWVIQQHRWPTGRKSVPDGHDDHVQVFPHLLVKQEK